MQPDEIVTFVRDQMAFVNQDGTVTFNGERYEFKGGHWEAGRFIEKPTSTTRGQSYAAYALPWKDALVVIIPATRPGLLARWMGVLARPETRETWSKVR